MPSAARSFTLPPGFIHSALPRIWHPVRSDSDLSKICSSERPAHTSTRDTRQTRRDATRETERERRPWDNTGASQNTKAGPARTRAVPGACFQSHVLDHPRPFVGIVVRAWVASRAGARNARDTRRGWEGGLSVGRSRLLSDLAIGARRLSIA